MNRRDFLTLTTRDSKRVLELSCERLYMRYVDARSGIERRGASRETDPHSPSSGGEPPMQIETRTTRALFDELERELAGADVLRMLDRQWLAGEEFGPAVEARIQAFRRRGGRVECGESSP